MSESYRDGGFIDCERCGQYRTLNESGVCEMCRMAERQPQGEAVRLFTPAPAQMPGQMSMRRAGQFACAACGTDEAMPGHEC